MKIKLFHISTIMIFMATWLCSCCHKNSICPDSEMRQIFIDFDWKHAPNACPEGMTIYFFPISDEGLIWKFDIAGRDGGPVEIPTGKYQMLAFNNDLPGIDFIDTKSFYSFAAAVHNIIADTIISSTGMLYASELSYLDITSCGVNYIASDKKEQESCGKSMVRCYPDSVTTLYSVIINEVKGIEHVKSAGAYLNGVSSGITLSSGEPVGKPVSLKLPLDIDHAGAAFNASAYAFAPSPDPSRRYTLKVMITRTDGKSFTHDFDVTEQVMNSIPSKNVIILINGIEIPTGDIPDNPGEDVGNIDVGVDGWATIEIDIESIIF